MIFIDAYSILMWLVTAIVGSLGLVIYLGSKKLSTKVFVTLAIFTIIWMFGVGIIRSTASDSLIEFFIRFDYFIGIAIAACFFYFCLTFPEDNKPKRWIVASLVLLESAFVPLCYYGLITNSHFYIGGVQKWGWDFGPLWFLFDIFFSGFWIAGLYILYRKYKNFPPGREKINLKFMFLGMLIAIIPPSFVNVMLPRLGHFDWNWLGPVSSLGWVSIISYSIVKYRQMNVKAVAAEVFVLVMALVLLANVFVGDATFGVAGRLIIFLAFIIIGYVFIKSILKESEQKEQLGILNAQLTDLNQNLQQKVDEQTVEIRRAYEVEKKARVELEELDKAKDQFILTTQHHLRTPLTIVKGYLQSFLSEKTASVDAEGKSYLEKAFSATDRIASLINEFLDVSQMQVGKSILRKEPVNLRTLMEGILDDLSTGIDRSHLSTSLTFPPREEDNILNIDKEKIKEALTNLLDNAVKYNKEGGEIRVKGEKTRHPIERDKEIYRLTIEDTGIGITEEELSKLFKQYFERGKEAEKLYATGRGIGLVVTKNIIEAHGGRAWAESEGRNKGSKFIVELPVM